MNIVRSPTLTKPRDENVYGMFWRRFQYWSVYYCLFFCCSIESVSLAKIYLFRIYLEYILIGSSRDGNFEQLLRVNLISLGEPSLKKTGKFGKNSQLGLTPPPRIIQNFLNFSYNIWHIILVNFHDNPELISMNDFTGPTFSMHILYGLDL